MQRTATLLALLVLLSATSGPLHAAAPTAKAALALKPVHSDVEIDMPDDPDKCVVKAERMGEGTGWIVRDPNGLILRRFVDSNNDNIVDMWCYYLHGLEVYRDIDSDFNNKADQHRWFSTAGRRWGIDKNEDGRIDVWRAISAEEVSAEVVAALGDNDAARFERLLLSEEELASLGLGEQKQKLLRDKVAAATESFRRTVAGGNPLAANAKWVSFSATRPGIIPQGTDGSTQDLTVYENVAAMTEADGKQGMVQIGTLIQVGDAWRLIDAPKLPGSDVAEIAEDGFFYQAALVRGGGAVNLPASGASEAMQKLIEQLQQIDQAAAGAAPAARSKLHAQRAGLLEQLIEAATPADRENWVRQLADSVSAAVQSAEYPDGVEKLQALAAEQKRQGNQDLAAYVAYRYLMANYAISMQGAGTNFAKVQAEWLKSLEAFVKEFPSSPDSADAMLQLAIAQEFAGEEDEARKWYATIASQFRSTPAAEKAAGAKRRLESVGREMELIAPTLDNKKLDLSKYRGRVVLVQYWATWCDPCKKDMDQLKALVGTYGRRGFSVVGVNLDSDRNEAIGFLRTNTYPWYNVYEPGGLDSRLANEMGILTLPTMILLDDKGKVVDRNVHVSQVEEELKKRLK